MNNTKSNLTRVEIADTIYKELGIPRSESVIFVDQIVDQIINSLVTKKIIKISSSFLERVLIHLLESNLYFS